jgi:hypothetical protein
MNAASLLSDLRAQGVHLEADAGALRYRAPRKAITAELLATLETHKADLLAALSDQESIAVIADRHGLTLTELEEAAGPDWPEVEADPKLAQSFANAIQTRRLREHGQIPPSYTSVTVCAGCGPVPIWAGAPEHVLACPWCFNRIAGKAIPTPKSRSEQHEVADG